MPALGKLKIAVAVLAFAAAWIAFTQPGRRVLEQFGLYTECAIDVWSLRRHCVNLPAEPRADPPAEARQFAKAPPAEPAPAPQHAPTAQAAPVPASPEAAEAKVTPAAVGHDRCFELWNSATHMSKGEWRTACVRLQSAAGKRPGP
jgi:hypothetical protein